MTTQIFDLNSIPPRRRRVVCIGNFDGVHRGHQSLLNRGRDLADRLGVLKLTALSFWPPPSQYFRPEIPLKLLSLPAERSRLLAQAGVDEPIYLPFNRSLADLSPEAFVQEILIHQLQVQGVVVGVNFRFGSKRQGHTDQLQSLLNEAGARLEIVTKIEEDAEIISSTRVRTAITKGDFSHALELLGHSYPLSGVVIKGDGRGRKIGFPTANLAVPAEKHLPTSGVYGGRMVWDGQKYIVIVNIGTKPTFKSKGSTCVEAHVLDAPPELDLYGEELYLELDCHLRDEHRFANADALMKQIKQDIEVLRGQQD